MSTTHKILPEPKILPQIHPPYIDARIYAFNKFTSKDGQPSLMVSASADGKIDNASVSFAIPSHPAICLHVANQAHTKSSSVDLSSLVINSKNSHQIASDKIGWLYNFFEQRFLNIVFSFTALEAFANQTIPDDYIFTKMRQDRRCNEVFNKEQIERHFSLDIKLAEVLPEITGIKFEKSTKLWGDYAKLKSVRDRIVHVKSVDLGIKDKDSQSVWAVLLDDKDIDFSMVAHKVIKHFPIKHDPSSSPVAQGRDCWIRTFPFKGAQG